MKVLTSMFGVFLQNHFKSSTRLRLMQICCIRVVDTSTREHVKACRNYGFLESYEEKQGEPKIVHL